MDIRLWLYRFTKNRRFRRIRGFWRYKAWTEALIMNKYFKLPYLEGYAWVCPAHEMGMQVFFKGIYEPVVICFIREFVGKGFSFVDVGANVGLHTMAAAFSKMAETQYFYAFEPEKSMFSILKRNCLSNNLPFVISKQEAIGEKEGSLILYVSTDNNKGGNSLIPQKNTAPGEEVKVSTLDVIFNKNPFLELPVLVKVDVEGFEPEVIRGGKQWLSKVEDACVVCEIGPKLGNAPSEFESFLSNMKSAGFDKSWIVRDPESVNSNGKFTGISYNMLFIKGAKANQIAANLSHLLMEKV